MCTVTNYDFLVFSKYCPGSNWHLGPPEKLVRTETVHVEEQNSMNSPKKVLQLKATQLGYTLPDVPHDDVHAMLMCCGDSCRPVDRDILYPMSPMMTCACQVSGLWG